MPTTLAFNSSGLRPQLEDLVRDTLRRVLFTLRILSIPLASPNTEIPFETCTPRGVAPTTSFASTHFLQQMSRRRSGGAAAQATHAASGEPVNATMKNLNTSNNQFIYWLHKMYVCAPAATDQNALRISGVTHEHPRKTDLVGCS